MAIVRTHLRLLATAWILFQATSLSALVPRACCLAHSAAMAKTAVDCHQKSPEPQAMHHMHGATHQQAAQPVEKPAGDCAIRGLCGGPLAAMFAIFSTQGVLTERAASLTALNGTAATLVPTDQLIGLSAPPDAPPPRA